LHVRASLSLQSLCKARLSFSVCFSLVGKLSCCLLGLVSHDSGFERLCRATVTELPADGSGVSRSKATLISVQG